jgi:1-aminocyclopropane-1-carboxylate deaminase
MQPLNFNNITIDAIHLSGWMEQDIDVSVLRLDKIHPIISGNKWFKLRYYIEEALQTKKQTIATFGGAWSNHIVATAAACQQNNIASVGIIRGEKPTVFSPTLLAAASSGMKLYFLSRQDYKEKRIPAAIEPIKDSVYFINEGGYGEKGAAGAETIAGLYDPKSYTHICCATGTGTMMAGLVKSAVPNQHVIGISVLKNYLSLENEIKALLTSVESKKPFNILHDYHFGGYAKTDSRLLAFINDFYQETGIPSDFVYTGKLFFAINELMLKNYFPAGSRVLVIHSGGLQGNSSLERGMLIF